MSIIEVTKMVVGNLKDRTSNFEVDGFIWDLIVLTYKYKFIKI